MFTFDYKVLRIKSIQNMASCLVIQFAFCWEELKILNNFPWSYTQTTMYYSNLVGLNTKFQRRLFCMPGCNHGQQKESGQRPAGPDYNWSLYTFYTMRNKLPDVKCIYIRGTIFFKMFKNVFSWHLNHFYT